MVMGGLAFMVVFLIGLCLINLFCGEIEKYLSLVAYIYICIYMYLICIYGVYTMN